MSQCIFLNFLGSLLCRSGSLVLLDAILDLIPVGLQTLHLVHLNKLEQLVFSGQWNQLSTIQRITFMRLDGG